MSQSSLISSKLIYLLLHDVIEAVVKARHTDHDSGLEDSQVLLDLKDVALEETVLHLVAHGANEEAALENVSKWEVRNVNIIVSEFELTIEAVHTANIGDKVEVSQHDTLGHTSGTRSVGEGVESFTGNLIVGLLSGLLTLAESLSVGNESETSGLSILKISLLHLIEVDDVLGALYLTLLLELDDVLKLVGREHNSLVVGLVQDVLK